VRASGSSRRPGDRLHRACGLRSSSPDIADENVRSFFAETLALVQSAPAFAALAHLDYPKRYWPHDRLRYSELDFEAEYRGVLATAAAARPALEINTDCGDLAYGPCPDAIVVRLWREVGARAISFGERCPSSRSFGASRSNSPEQQVRLSGPSALPGARDGLSTVEPEKGSKP
jgi:hypothetical protein